MKKTIMINSSDYGYPTASEIKAAKQTCPDLTNFNFEPKHPITSILMENRSLEEASRIENLYFWDSCFQNKLGHLIHSFIHVNVYYNRGISQNISEYSEEECFNKIQLDFYSETFYYFFFSARDIVFQIINIYCGIELPEKRVNFSNLESKITNPDLITILKEFANETASSYEIRNSITHRFPKNYPDHRSKISQANNQKMLNGGTGTSISTKEIVRNMYKSLNDLNLFLNSLKIAWAL